MSTVLPKGLIVVQKKGGKIPKSFLEKVVSEYTSCFGIAGVVDGELMLQQQKIGIKIDDLEAILELFDGNGVVMHFGEYPLKFLEEDVQPFTLLSGADGKPSIVVFIEGDHSAHKMQDSGHIGEFFLANNILAPTVQTYDRLTKSNLDTIMTEMKADSVNKLLIGSTSQPATFCLLAKNRQVVNHSSREEAKDFPGFWCSDTLGWVEEVAAPPAEPAKELSPAEMMRAKMEARKKASVPTTGAPPTNNEGSVIHNNPKPQDPKPDTAIPDKVTEPQRNPDHIYPPDDGSTATEGQLKDWYRNYGKDGKLPSDFKSRPGVKPKKPELLKTFGGLAGKVISGTDPFKAAIDAKATKTVDSASTKLAVDNTRKRPIIPNEQSKNIVDVFLKDAGVKKFLDGASQVVIDPVTIQAMEAEFPTYTEKTGISLEEIAKWPFEVLLKHVMDYPEATAVLVMELRNRTLLAEKYATPVAGKDKKVA